MAKMFLSQSEKSEVISKLTQENYQLRKQIRKLEQKIRDVEGNNAQLKRKLTKTQGTI